MAFQWKNHRKMAHAREKKGQPTWLELKLNDLRHEEEDHGLDTPEMIAPGSDAQSAEDILKSVFGLTDGTESVLLEGPIGFIQVKAEQISHIVEKRQDARERYANFAIDTVRSPYEIWEIQYEQDADENNPAREFFRYAYIGFFKGTKQMLVTVDVMQDCVLWNFMHQERKALNKHRHGRLLYERQKASLKPAFDGNFLDSLASVE